MRDDDDDDERCKISQWIVHVTQTQPYSRRSTSIWTIHTSLFSKSPQRWKSMRFCMMRTHSIQQRCDTRPHSMRPYRVCVCMCDDDKAIERNRNNCSCSCQPLLLLHYTRCDTRCSVCAHSNRSGWQQCLNYIIHSTQYTRKRVFTAEWLKVEPSFGYNVCHIVPVTLSRISTWKFIDKIFIHAWLHPMNFP